MATSLAGTRALVRHALRRDRVMAPVWGLMLVGVCYASAAATASLYASPREQVAAAEAINSTPAIVALYGPILDVHSLGELAMTKMTVLYAVAVAALFVMMVRRHTRSEEEAGLTELLGGTAVGRQAPLASAVLEATAIALAIGAATTLANIAGGLAVTGSVAFGASWFGIGLVAIGVSAVACQLSASARTCGAAAAGILGVAYAMRAVGDTSAAWLSWLSPFGWATQLRAYSHTRWWVLGLYAALALVLVVAAAILSDRRDLGSGLVAARPGRSSATSRLLGAVTLAARVHAATLTVWTAGTAGMGAVLGAIVPNVSNLLATSSAKEMMARLGGPGAVENALVAAELSFIAVAVTCFGIAVIAHSATDELAGRTELVIAAGTSRSRSYLASTVVAFLGTAWLLLVTGISVALGDGIGTHDLGTAFSQVVPAALVQTPAVWVVVALGAILFASRARSTPAAWALIGAFVTLGQVGELLNLPTWVIDLSPYSHTPPLPAGSFTAGPVLALVGVAALLYGIGWRLYRTRDIG